MSQEHWRTYSTEKYLKAIFFLERKNGAVRVRDIAAMLSFQKGTVSGALKKFKAHKWIDYQPYGAISLTSSGRRIARGIVQRDNILKQFLTEVLQMRPEDSERAAGRMGHAVEQKVIEQMLAFVTDSKSRAVAN